MREISLRMLWMWTQHGLSSGCRANGEDSRPAMSSPIACTPFSSSGRGRRRRGAACRCRAPTPCGTPRRMATAPRRWTRPGRDRRSGRRARGALRPTLAGDPASRRGTPRPPSAARQHGDEPAAAAVDVAHRLLRGGLAVRHIQEVAAPGQLAQRIPGRDVGRVVIGVAVCQPAGHRDGMVPRHCQDEHQLLQVRPVIFRVPPRDRRRGVPATSSPSAAL